MHQMYPPLSPLPVINNAALIHDRSLPPQSYSFAYWPWCSTQNEAGTTLLAIPAPALPTALTGGTHCCPTIPLPCRSRLRGTVLTGSHCWHATGASCRMTSYQARPHPKVLPATTTTNCPYDPALWARGKNEQHDESTPGVRPCPSFPSIRFAQVANDHEERPWPIKHHCAMP